MSAKLCKKCEATSRLLVYFWGFQTVLHGTECTTDYTCVTCIDSSYCRELASKFATKSEFTVTNDRTRYAMQQNDPPTIWLKAPRSEGWMPVRRYSKITHAENEYVIVVDGHV